MRLSKPFVERFEREALCNLFDVGPDYLVMELLPRGQSLVEALV